MSNNLPPLKYNWIIDINNQAASTNTRLEDSQDTALVLKEVLTNLSSNPWTVVSSSNADGVTGDGGNVLGLFTDNSINSNDGIAVNMGKINAKSSIAGGTFSTVSMDFNTSNEYVKMGNVLNFDHDDAFSISFWFKKVNTTTTAAVSKYDGTQGYVIFVSNFGAVNIKISNNGTTEIDVQTTRSGLNDGAWHNAVCTYDGYGAASGVSIYIDGVLEPTTINEDTLAGNSIITSAEFNISGYNNGTSEFGGLIDDVAVYNKELSIDEVSEIFNHIATQFSEKSLVFDGTTEHVSMGDVVELSFERTNSFSLSCWIKCNTGPGAFLAKQEASPDFQGYSMGVNSSGEILVQIINSFGNRILLSSINLIDDDKWHHVVMTYDGSSAASGVNVYLDNKSEFMTVDEDTLSATIDNTQPFLIGARGSGSDLNFTGFIDDASVFDVELTSSQVDEIYNSGAPSDLRLSSINGSMVGYWRMGDGATFSTIPDDSSNSNDGTMSGGMAAGDITDTVPIQKNQFRSSSQYSLLFGGSNEILSIGNVATLKFDVGDEFSISCWIKTTSSGSQMSIVSKRSSSAAATGYDFGMTSAGRVFFQIIDDVSIPQRVGVWDSTTSRADGAWHHIAITKGPTENASDLTLYINNEDVTEAFDDTFVSGGGTSFDNTINFQISGHNGTNLVFVGNVDDVGVYDIKLSSNDINTIYNGGYPNDLTSNGPDGYLVGYWQMGDGATFPTIPDGSVNSNSGTMTNMEESDISPVVPTSDGYIGNLNIFGATNDLVGYWFMGDSALQPSTNDNWFSPTDVVWGDKGTNHSWIVLQHPIKNTQLLWDFSVSFSAGLIARFAVSLSGSFAGGDTLNAPTAPDAIKANTTNNDFINWIGNNGGAFSSWIHVWQTVDGLKTRILVSTTRGAGTGAFIILDEIDSIADKWANKEFIFYLIDSSSSGLSTSINNILQNSVDEIVIPGGVSDLNNYAYSCVDLDGSPEDIEVGDVAELSFERTDSFSFSFWFKMSSTSGAFLSKRGAATARTGYVIFNNSGGVGINLSNDNGAGDRIRVVTNNTYNDDLWHHCVVTYDGSSAASGVTIFIDDSSAATTTTDDSLTGTIDNSSEFRIGAQGPNASEDSFFTGKITQLGAYNTELSSTEISEIFNDGIPLDLRNLSSASNLAGFWRLGDEDDITTFTDGYAGNDGLGENLETADIFPDAPAIIDFKLGTQMVDIGIGASAFLPLSTAASVKNELDDGTASQAYPIMPIVLFAESLRHRGVHGVIDDLWAGTNALNTTPGDTYPDDGYNRQFAQSGGLVFPWTNDSTAPMLGGSSPANDTHDGHFTGVSDVGTGNVEYFQMTGIDLGAPSYPTYTSWQVTGTPDLDGSEATPIFGGPIINIEVSHRWIE